LLNLAAGETLARHGRAFAVEAARLPNQGQLAALFRYAITGPPDRASDSPRG
jgi:hypothetical protein